MVDFLVFSIFLAGLLFCGIYRAKGVKTESAYLFAERKIAWGPLTATLVMTEFNSATLISFSSLGYLVGFRALLLPGIFLIGLLFYALTVAKKWKNFDGVSVAGVFEERFGKKLGLIASSSLLLAMVGFSAAYIKSITLLFSPLLPGVNPWLLSSLLVILMGMMSLRGGLVSIVRIDMLSFVFVLLFFPFIGWIMWSAPVLSSSSIEVSQIQEALPLRFLLSLTLLTMFTYILAPWYGQKIFSAKTPRVAFWAVLAAAVLVFFLYGAAVFSTALLRIKGYECLDFEQALPYIIHYLLPKGVKGGAYAFLFAISATTLSGVWNAMTSMWVGDFLRKQKSEGCLRGIFITLGFALASLILANTLVDRVLDKLILANIPVAALSFGLLAGFYWKRATWQGVYISVVMGFLCGVSAYWIFGEERGYTWYWAVYGIPLTFLAGIIGSLATSLKTETA